MNDNEEPDGCMLAFSPKGIAIIHPGGRIEIVAWEDVKFGAESDIEDGTYSSPQVTLAISQHLKAIAAMFDGQGNA
jgi:hypothetical protein